MRRVEIEVSLLKLCLNLITGHGNGKHIEVLIKHQLSSVEVGSFFQSLVDRWCYHTAVFLTQYIIDA